MVLPGFTTAVALLLVGPAADVPIGPAPPPACEASTYGWGEPLNTHVADGTRFDPNAMEAAHWTLPFGTDVTVTDTASGRSVTVTITDRGPHPRLGRCIDLTAGAWRALGRTRADLTDVVLEVHP